MSWSRQIKTLLTLNLILVIFAAWITITNLLFGNVTGYKLFFASLVDVFLIQFIYNKKSDTKLIITLSVIATSAFMFILFDGIEVLINSVFAIICIYINLSMEKLAVDYEEYKSKAKQGAIILVGTIVVSFWLEKSIANYICGLSLNYIIITTILLRESRDYYYKVKKDIKRSDNKFMMKNLLKDILFKYGLVVISTVTFVTDSGKNKSFNLMVIFSKFSDVVLTSVLNVITSTVGVLVAYIIHKLNGLLGQTEFLSRLELAMKSIKDSQKFEYVQKVSTTKSDIIITYTVMKVTLLVIIGLVIFYSLSNMKFMKSKNEDYVENKRRICNDSNVKSNKTMLIKKIFKKNATTRGKILDTYKKFEEIAYKVQIYKPYMTATELKNTTKSKIKDNNYNCINEITDIYNEVKFSNCEPSEEQLVIVKKAVDNIKKELS